MAKRIYLAGPMTGLPDLNRPAFYAAARALAERGYEVFNPAEADEHDPEATPDKPREWFLRRDIPELCRSDAVAVLPGWRNSIGAQVEVYVARAIGLPVLDAQTLEPVDGESLAQEAERIVYGPRRRDYGHPQENHQRTAALWSAYLGTPVSPVQVCVCNILQKISRMHTRLTRDSLVDVIGYALNIAIVAGIEDRGQA